MKIAVLMWYDRGIEEYANNFFEINKLYCTKNNYALIKSNRRTYQDRRQTWERFPLLLRHIEEYDYVVWIDADAFFYYSAPPLEEIINLYKKDILLSQDHETFITPDTINAGVFILKNTPPVIKLLKEWVHNDELKLKFQAEGRSLGFGGTNDNWIEDQSIIRGCLRNNIHDMKDITAVIPYMKLQHFHQAEIEILKENGIMPLIYHAAGKSPSYRYYISKVYLDKLRGLPSVGDLFLSLDRHQSHHPRHPRHHQRDQDQE